MRRVSATARWPSRCTTDGSIRRRLPSHAAARGIVLLSGIERTIDGKHVLLINVPREAGDVRSFDDVRALKQQTPAALVVAPHPFYPIPSALGARPGRASSTWSTRSKSTRCTRSGLDYNRRARAWAAAHGKALVGNTDLHRLDQIGTTWSEVDAPPDADAICAAIRAGRVVVRSRPLSWPRALWTMARMELGGLGRGEPGRGRPRVHGFTGSRVHEVHGFTGSRVHGFTG